MEWPSVSAVFQVERVAQRLQRHVVGFLQVRESRFPLLGAGRHQRFEVGAVGVVFALEAPVFKGAANGSQQLFALEGLQQVVVGAVAQGLQGDGDVVHRRDHDERHIGIALFGMLQEGDSIHFGHHEVGEYEVEFVARLKDGKGFDTARSLARLKIRTLEHGRNNLADRLLVIYHQYAIVGHKP